VTTITREDIDNWAFGRAPSVLDALAEEDCDLFDHLIGSVLTEQDLLDLANSEDCIQQDYFFDELCKRLCWIYRIDLPLPMHFSRMQGMMSFAEYESEAKKILGQVYEKFSILDRMQRMQSAKIRNAAKILLNFRHERCEIGSERYYQILKELASSSRNDQFSSR
jgi:hypothetical protein